MNAIYTNPEHIATMLRIINTHGVLTVLDCQADVRKIKYYDHNERELLSFESLWCRSDNPALIIRFPDSRYMTPGYYLRPHILRNDVEAYNKLMDNTENVLALPDKDEFLYAAKYLFVVPDMGLTKGKI